MIIFRLEFFSLPTGMISHPGQSAMSRNLYMSFICSKICSTLKGKSANKHEYLAYRDRFKDCLWVLCVSNLPTGRYWIIGQWTILSTHLATSVYLEMAHQHKEHKLGILIIHFNVFYMLSVAVLVQRSQGISKRNFPNYQSISTKSKMTVHES